MNKRQLLCTFSLMTTFKNTIEDIKKFYIVNANRFFVFTNESSPQEVFITYNISCEDKEFPKFPNTISIHRKKLSNTLYTLNAMNQIIKDENGGRFDKAYAVDWSKYSNSLIITGQPSIRIIPIRLLEMTN